MFDLTTIPLYQRLLRRDCPESTKRALALLAGGTLCGGLLIVVLAIWWQAAFGKAVDGNLIAALTVICAAVAGLAGVAYRKPELPNAAPLPTQPGTQNQEGTP